MNQIKSFTAIESRINEALQNRNLSADSVISIIPINTNLNNSSDAMCVVYYKCESNIDIYDILARKTGLRETGAPNQWIDKYGKLFFLTKFGFKPIENENQDQ